jgi:hypothetical protein
VDTDGNPGALLPLYIQCGFTAWSPCEVAAGCDPVEMARKYPELVILGGFDTVCIEFRNCLYNEPGHVTWDLWFTNTKIPMQCYPLTPVDCNISLVHDRDVLGVVRKNVEYYSFELS